MNDSEKEDINHRDIASERSSPSEAPSDIISDYRFRYVFHLRSCNFFFLNEMGGNGHLACMGKIMGAV